MTHAHDDPAIAAARAFGADLPLLPAETSFRTKLKDHQIEKLCGVRTVLIEALADAVRELQALYGEEHPTVRQGHRAIVLARLTS